MSVSHKRRLASLLLLLAAAATCLSLLAFRETPTPEALNYVLLPGAVGAILLESGSIHAVSRAEIVVVNVACWLLGLVPIAVLLFTSAEAEASEKERFTGLFPR